MPFTDMTTAKTRAQLTRRRMELVRKNKMAEIRIKRVYMALGVPRVRIETIGHPVINHMKRKITYDVDEAGAIHLRVSGHVEYQYATGIPITKKLKAPGQD